MTIPELVKQGFKLFCIMCPSDKYKQGIDLDFTDELEDRSVPGVYILSNSKQEILKIGQSSDLYTRGCISPLQIQLMIRSVHISKKDII